MLRSVSASSGSSNVANHTPRGLPRYPRNKSKAYTSPSSQCVIASWCTPIFSFFCGSVIRVICSLLFLGIFIAGDLEYQRLLERASVFHKRWNPIAESFDEFYETEKRSAKNALFAQWHGANTFYDWNIVQVDADVTKDNKEGAATTPSTLKDLLTIPSRHPFSRPLDATKSHRSKTSSLVAEPPKQRQIGDVTLILNHFQRNTLMQQLNAIMSFSVLPREVWVCLFKCGYEREAIYRKQVSNFLTRFAEQGSQLHVISSDFNFKYFGRFQLALQAPTGYVWIVDDDVIPGARYLEVMFAQQLE
jgi:hypothetical protein